jgi:hypothetical protein
MVPVGRTFPAHVACLSFMHTEKHLKKQLSAKSEAERKARVNAAFGLFAHTKSSSEDFARRKAEEIELEERNHRTRHS